GTYEDGRIAAVTQTVGEGRTMLLGFYPGFAYRANGRALGPVQPWFTEPIVDHLGGTRVSFSYPASEATLFEHTSGLAVTLANFTPARVEPSTEPTTLSVVTDREIREVVSALRGPLPWKRVG